MLEYIKTKSCRAGLLAVTAGLLLVSCADDIVIDNVDENNWSGFENSYAMLRSVTNTTRSVQSVELRDKADVELKVILTKAVDAAVSVPLEVDPDLVDAYNDVNYTEYEAFPVSNVKLSGPAEIGKWQTESASVTLSLTYPDLDEGTYLLPVRVASVSGGVELSEGSDVIYYMVKVMASIPDNTKYVPGEPGRTIHTLCYVEVNSDDLRNVGIYELENSGKKFFDMCVIFAANIRADANGRVILDINETITHILDNADVYIKPLQDQGIKVLMGLLGGGSYMGLASLRGESLTDFANQVKNIVEVYNLDGVDFDDEWSDYDTSATSMWAPSGTQHARLIIECRRLMPDKIITVFEYNYSRQMTAGTYDGVVLADQIDFSMQAVYNSWIANSTITGMPDSKYSPYAYWINNSTSLNTRTRDMRNGDYGFFFCYALNATDATGVLTTASNNLFDEPVVRIQDSYIKSF